MPIETASRIYAIFIRTTGEIHSLISVTEIEAVPDSVLLELQLSLGSDLAFAATDYTPDTLPSPGSICVSGYVAGTGTNGSGGTATLSVRPGMITLPLLTGPAPFLVPLMTMPNGVVVNVKNEEGESIDDLDNGDDLVLTDPGTYWIVPRVVPWPYRPQFLTLSVTEPAP